MVRKRINELMDMFPYFFNKSETSNFFKSQSVTNNQLLHVYQSIHDISDSFRLNKRCLIWKEQSEPYDYIINFVANYPHLKSVNCYKNDSLIYSEQYLEEDDVSSFIYSYDSSEETTTLSDNSNDNEEENLGEESIPIIPEDTFKIIVETYDEYIIKKGFPENDEPQGNEYDHDESLDEIGALNDIPRKNYIVTEDYAHTEPPYNNRLTEDDYHYMNRILTYNLHIHDTQLPVLEIWKIYGIFADMVNREQYLLKMFDETKHPFNNETGLVQEWTPLPWEHKDKLCELQEDLGRFFFVSANTLLPVKNQSVKFNFKYLNMLAEDLQGDYNVTITLKIEGEDDTVLVEQYNGEQYIVTSDYISDDEANVFLFEAYEGDDLFATEELTVYVRGCNTADWYVNDSTGNDTNNGQTTSTPFKTISKALSMVNGEQNLIVLASGTYNITNPLNVPVSSTVLGCGTVTIENTVNPKFFRVYQNQELNLQDLTLTYDESSSTLENEIFKNNNKTNNPLYVVIPEDAGKTRTTITVSTDETSYTIGDSIVITGTLVDADSEGLTGEDVKIYIGNELIDTVTTLTDGEFTKTITASTSGSLTIRAVYEGSEEYSGSNDSVSVTVNKKTTTITFSSNKASYIIGETISLSGSLSSGSTDLSSASVKIYDGSTLVDTVTTDSNGDFSKSVSATSLAEKTYTAVYEGTSTYASVTSTGVSVSIVKGTSTISLSASSSSISVGDSVTLSGTLSRGSGYSVKIYKDGTLLDTVTTGTGGAYSKTVTGLAAGNYSFTASYEGDSTYDGATSSAVTVSVGKTAATLSIARSPSSGAYGTSFTIAGTLSAGSGKSVKLYQNNTLLDTLTTGTSGSYTKTVTPSAVGEYTYYAVFDGDDTYSNVTSSSVSLTVTKATPTISLSTSSSTTTIGTSFTLSGTLSLGTGKTVKLYDSTNTLIDTLTTGSGGAFSKSITQNTSGSYTYYATYEGDSNYNSVNSSNVTVTVNKLTPTISLATTSASVTVGDSFTLSGTLAYNNVGISSASIKIYQGATLLDTVSTGSNGGFSKTITASTAGTFSYEASYEGSSTYADVDSTSVSVVVSGSTPTPASITLTSDKSILSKYDNEYATLTATVLDANSQPCEGETVTFEARKSSDDSLIETLTGTTNSSGVATVYYYGKGEGDIYIKADCMFIIQTCTIEDCMKVGFKSTDTFHAIASSNSMTVTDGVATGYNKLTNYTVSMSSDFEITIDYQCSRLEGGVVLADLNNTNNFDKNCYQILTQDASYGISFNGYTGTTRSFHKTLSSSDGLNQFNSIKFVKQSGTVSAYFNGTLIGSNSVLSNGIIDLCVGMYRWNVSNTQSMKNLKIKLL